MLDSKNMKLVKEINHIALQLCNYDEVKTNLWLLTRRQDLHNISPMSLIKQGKIKEVYEWIKTLNICSMDTYISS